MQSLNPTRILARRERDTMIIGALLLMSGVAACAVTVFLSLLFSTSANIFVFGLVGITVLLLITGVVFVIRGLTMRSENPAAVVVVDALTRELDKRYTFIRNISRQGLGYIDGVLVGPPGVLVFYLVDKPGAFTNEGADWLERKPGGAFALSRLNATRNCISDIYALRKYLARHQLAHVPVYGLVVFTAQGVQLSARQPVVPIAELRTMTQVMRADYMKEERIDAKTIDATVNAIYE